MRLSNTTYETRDATVTGNTLSGTVHAFGVRALVGQQYEEFAPTAFDSILERVDTDIRAFWNHNTDLLLGRQGNGSLSLAVEDGVLKYSVDLPETSYAADLKSLVARGDLDGMSFGFIPDKIERLTAPDGRIVRRHVQVKQLIEVSPVSLPSFDGTAVQLHSTKYEMESLNSQLVRAKARVYLGR